MTDGKRGPGRRLLWFAGIWVAGVAALAIFGYGLRALIAL